MAEGAVAARRRGDRRRVASGRRTHARADRGSRRCAAPPEGVMSTRHRLLSLLVENHPGVLNKVSSMIRRRGMNITSLSVGETDDDSVSRMTIAVDVGRAQADQAVKQLYKLIEVIKVADITEDPIVDRELVLAKVAAQRGDRSE